MECRLAPYEGAEYLDTDDVVARLRGEFAHVQADRDLGYDHMGDVIAKLLVLQAPQEIIDQQLAIQDRTISVAVTDDSASDAYLSFFVKPDLPIVCCLNVGQEAEVVRPLVERCARALGYRDLDE
jgi:hypothetical protein